MKTIFRNQKSPPKLFFMIWGQKKNFEKKKVKFAPKKQKKRDFQKFVWPIFWPERDKVAPDL